MNGIETAARKRVFAGIFLVANDGGGIAMVGAVGSNYSSAPSNGSTSEMQRIDAESGCLQKQLTAFE